MNLANSISSVGGSGALDSLTDPDKLTMNGLGINAKDLQAAGREFESVFFSLLLKEMRTVSDESGEGGLFAGDKTDTLGGLFDLYMSQHLASSNSLGIAKAVETYLANQSENSESTNTPNAEGESSALSQL